MARINSQNYLERRPDTGSYRNWWLVKGAGKNAAAPINIKIKFPPEMIGKRIMFKVEEVEDDQ